MFFRLLQTRHKERLVGMIAKEPVNVNTIAERFDVSRQTIPLHLKVLAECGLLSMKQQDVNEFVRKSWKNSVR